MPGGVAGRTEAEALQNEGAGGGVERGVVARLRDVAGAGAALWSYRDGDGGGALGVRFARGEGVV